MENPALHSKELFSEHELAKVHSMVQAYMQMLVSRSSKQINSSDFAKLIH